MTYRPVGHSLRVPRRTRTSQILKSSLDYWFVYGNNRAAKRRVAPPGPEASSIRRLSLLFWFNQNSLANNSARLFTEIAGDLVMMSVLTLTDILGGLFVKRLFASWGAKVVRLSLIFGRAGRGLGINFHSTYGVFYCICHTILSFPLIQLSL
jgi:hypothetical protein